MKTAQALRKRVPKQKLVLNKDMDLFKLYKLFQEIMKSEKDLTKRVFLEYYKIYPKLIEHNNSLCSLFGYATTFVVRDDDMECKGNTLVGSGDNHGHASTWLEIETLLKGKWKKIYTRPNDLTLGRAFQLAQSLRDRKGIITLTKTVASKYRFTLVGSTHEQVTFTDFCNKLNQYCNS